MRLQVRSSARQKGTAAARGPQISQGCRIGLQPISPTGHTGAETGRTAGSPKKSHSETKGFRTDCTGRHQRWVATGIRFITITVGGHRHNSLLPANRPHGLNRRLFLHCRQKLSLFTPLRPPSRLKRRTLWSRLALIWRQSAPAPDLWSVAGMLGGLLAGLLG